MLDDIFYELAAGPYANQKKKNKKTTIDDVDAAVHRLSKYAIANSLKIFWDRQVMKFIWKKKYSPQDASQFLG